MQTQFQNQNVPNLLTAAISNNTNGDNTIVAAPGAGLRLLVWHVDLVAAAAVNVTLKSGAATSLSGAYPLQAAGSSMALDFPAHAPLPIGTNLAFIINLSSATFIYGLVLYTIERV